MFDQSTVDMLFKGDTMTKYQLGDEFLEVDYSGREKGSALLLVVDGKVLIMKRKKADLLLRAVSSDPNYKYIRSAPVLLTKIEDYNDTIGEHHLHFPSFRSLLFIHHPNVSLFRPGGCVRTANGRPQLFVQGPFKYLEKKVDHQI